MKLGELLNSKNFKFRVTITVKPDETVSAAIQKLVEYDRGSLPVCNEKGEPVGIITERDIVRKCFKKKAFSEIRVRDIMSKHIIIGTLDDDVDYAISAMKQKRIRHIPIVDSNKVVGMISMRDLLGIRLEHANSRLKLLDDYISGGLR